MPTQINLTTPPLIPTRTATEIMALFEHILHIPSQSFSNPHPTKVVSRVHGQDQGHIRISQCLYEGNQIIICCSKIFIKQTLKTTLENKNTPPPSPPIITISETV